MGSIELCAGGDVRIDHEQVQPLLVVFVVHGGNQHAAGVDAHHGPRREVDDGNAGLAHELFRLVIGVNAGENHAVRAGAVIERELQELLRLMHSLTRLDLHGAEIGLAERVKVHEIGKQRLDLHVGKVDLLLNCGRYRRGLGGLWLGRFGLLVGIQRLHGRDKIPHME